MSFGRELFGDFDTKRCKGGRHAIKTAAPATAEVKEVSPGGRGIQNLAEFVTFENRMAEKGDATADGLQERLRISTPGPFLGRGLFPRQSFGEGFVGGRIFQVNKAAAGALFQFPWQLGPGEHAPFPIGKQTERAVAPQQFHGPQFNIRRSAVQLKKRLNGDGIELTGKSPNCRNGLLDPTGTLSKSLLPAVRE